MKASAKRCVMILTVLFAAGELNLGSGIELPTTDSLFFAPAEAAVVVTRPVVRPASPAGVARRTTRRVIRRGAYVAVIPVGCAYGTYYGYSLFYCGGVYYQKSGSGYVVVYF
jgi:hypothetical protein